jgi:hypothetical protein
MTRFRQRELPARILAEHRPGQHVEQQFEIFGAARKRPLNAHQGRGVRQVGQREHARARNRRFGRPMSIHAAIRARHPDRTADVAADFERRQTRRQRRAAAPGAAARCARQIPRIVRAAINGAVRLPVGERHRNVGFAEQARTRRKHRARERPVARGPIVFERGDARRLRQPGGLRGFFQRHRQAEQRSALAARECGIRQSRGVARPVRGTDRNRVQRAVAFVDALQMHLDQFDRRNLARAKRRQHFGCCAVWADRLRHELHSSA